MPSLEDVIRNAYRRKYCVVNSKNVEMWEDEYVTSDAKKTYTEYCKKFAKVLEVEDEWKKLKNNRGRFEFSEIAAKHLEETLFLYTMSGYNSIKSVTTKRLVDQILENEQYNAFVPEDIFAYNKKISDANNIIISIISCFEQLFLESELGEEKVDCIMQKAKRKYSYSKRKEYQKIFKIFVWYLEKLKQVNETRHDEIGLSEDENAIWLNYANDKLQSVMSEVLGVREKMVQIACTETELAISQRYEEEKRILVELNRYAEEDVIIDCQEDPEVQVLLERLKRNTGLEINISKLIQYIMMEEDVDALEIKEILNIHSDGNIKATKVSTSEVKNIINGLAEIIKNYSARYHYYDIYDTDINYRTRDIKLLMEAIMQYQNDGYEVC